MESIKSIFKIGNGPSSSHTMGPQKASVIFLEKNKDADRFICYLYGSLALTGKGHLTDYIIKKTLGEDKTEIIFEYTLELPLHPNGMMFEAYKNNKLIDTWICYSIGGGELLYDNSIKKEKKEIYPFKNMKEILDYCNKKNLNLDEFVLKFEPDILSYLYNVIDNMFLTIENGFKEEGYLPGKLKIKRRAHDLYNKAIINNDFDTLVFASALSTSEMNASGNIICTAPTCGSCGVIPSILFSYYKKNIFSKEKLVKSLLIAGLIGNLIRTNASISGAEVGCQGEIGAASSMASAMDCYLNGGNNYQIEYAAEIGLEHYLGMTCDPVMGYVQIPCIERNAISAKRAIDCSKYALLSDGNHYISLDKVIETMKQTGKDLNSKYKETSLGGLASGCD